MYQTIQTELKAGIMTLTLLGSGKLNAYSHLMGKELIDFYQSVNENDAVRVIVVRGKEDSFCAGMNLSEGIDAFSTLETAEDFRDSGGQVNLQVLGLSKPIIAAINGDAVGFGLTMTLPMDIRIVKEKAKLALPFGKIGISLEAISSYFLPKVVGINKALEWALTGRYIPVEEALNTGLVQYVDADPLNKAYEIAEAIIRNTSAVSNHFTRQVLWRSLEGTARESHRLESAYLHWVKDRPDLAEGLQAFLEKRLPHFESKSSDLASFFKD